MRCIPVKYQGTVGLNGRFTDRDGVFYGSGGYESGPSYNQHHGWGLWALAQHFLHTGDRAWFAGVADSVIKGIHPASIAAGVTTAGFGRHWKVRSIC